MAEILTSNQTLKQMKDNVRSVVESLDVCWRCQNVSECHRHVLGNLVLVWLCSGCLAEMELLNAARPQRARKPRKILA